MENTNPTEKLNELLTEYQKQLADLLAASELLQADITRLKGLIKDTEKVALKYK